MWHVSPEMWQSLYLGGEYFSHSLGILTTWGRVSSYEDAERHYSICGRARTLALLCMPFSSLDTLSSSNFNHLSTHNYIYIRETSETLCMWSVVRFIWQHEINSVQWHLTQGQVCCGHLSVYSSLHHLNRQSNTKHLGAGVALMWEWFLINKETA